MNRPATRSLREEILSLPLPQKSWRDFYSLQLIRLNCSDRVSFLKLQCGEVPILKYASQQGKLVFAIQVDADAPDVVRSCAKGRLAKLAESAMCTLRNSPQIFRDLIVHLDYGDTHKNKKNRPGQTWAVGTGSGYGFSSVAGLKMPVLLLLPSYTLSGLGRVWLSRTRFITRPRV